MNIIQNRDIASNYSPGRDGMLLDRIILHTMVGSIESAESRFSDPSQEVSAHYGIARDDDRIWNWVNPLDTAWHAGDWTTNLRSIGIEHEDKGDYNGTRPLDMYLRSAWLIQQITDWFDIPIDRAHIRDHRMVHATACPDALDTDRLIALAAGGIPMADIFTAAQKAYIDLRIREVVMSEDIAPFAVFQALGRATGNLPPRTAKRKAAPHEPAHHMKGKKPSRKR